MEAASTRTKTGTGENKPGVTSHSLNAKYKPRIGAAVNELFALFLMRIHDDIPGCVVGQFSKLKHLIAPNFTAFREAYKGNVEKSFLVPADTFDNVKGKFPIGFFVWRLGERSTPTFTEGFANASPSLMAVAVAEASDKSGLINGGVFTETTADVYDRKGEYVGTKTICAVSRDHVINTWLHGFFSKADDCVGWLRFVPNDFQNNSGVYITLKPNESDIQESRVAAITKSNFAMIGMYLAIRNVVDATWLNDRDQFLYPNDGWRGDQAFQSNCLIYALFHGQNRISSRDGVNHWIPFTEEEVGAKDCFKSHFMSDLINGRVASNLNPANLVGNLSAHSAPLRLCVKDHLSSAATSVLDAGRELWRYYHAQPGANPNASYYDIRLHFQGATTDAKGKAKMNASSTDATYMRLLSDLRAAMKRLAKEIEPKVYEYGFLKR